MQNTPDVFDHFHWSCCGDQSSPCLQTVHLPGPHPCLLTKVCPLIGIRGCCDIVPWIVQCPDVMSVQDDSDLIGTEIQAYWNPMEARSILQNWQ